MATKKRTEAQQQTVDRNIDIGNFIYHFYKNVVGILPDTSHYSAGHKILDGLMNNPDPKVRSYSFAELSVVCAYLKQAGVRIETLSLLHYPNLVSSIVNGRWEIAQQICDRLINEQQKIGVFTQEAIERSRPQGW